MAEKKASRLSIRFIIFFIIFAAICLFVLFQARSGNLSFNRIIHALSNTISGSAENTSISFDSNDNNRFYLSKAGFFVIAPDSLKVYNISGEEQSASPLAYRNPSVSGAGNTVAVFDRGNTSFFITNGKKTVFDSKAPAPILSMFTSKGGAFTLVTDGPDCKNLVSVFDKNHSEIYRLYSTDEYIASAAVSSNGEEMVTLSFTADEGQFQGKLFFYNLSDEAPHDSVILTDTMPLHAVFNSSDNIPVICNDRFIRFNSAGEKLSEILFGDAPLLYSALNSHKFSAFILDHRNTKNSMELISISKNSNEASRIDISTDVVSLSSAGNYLAVHFSDRVVVYKPNLTEVSTFSIPAGTRSVFVREDGSIMTIGTNWANLLIP